MLTGDADIPGVVRAYQTGRLVAFLQKQTSSNAALLAALREGHIRATRERAGYEQCQQIRRCLAQLSPAELGVQTR